MTVADAKFTFIVTTCSVSLNAKVAFSPVCWAAEHLLVLRPASMNDSAGWPDSEEPSLFVCRRLLPEPYSGFLFHCYSRPIGVPIADVGIPQAEVAGRVAPDAEERQVERQAIARPRSRAPDVPIQGAG